VHINNVSALRTLRMILSSLLGQCKGSVNEYKCKSVLAHRLYVHRPLHSDGFRVD